MFADFIAWILACLTETLSGAAGRAFWVLAGALIFGVLVCIFWLAWPRLFNRSFPISRLYIAFSVFTGLISSFFLLVFISLAFLEGATSRTIDRWEQSLLAHKEWSTELLEQLYFVVEKTGLEDMSNYPPPGEERFHSVPLTLPDTRELAANETTEAVVDHFSENHQFLAFVLWPDKDAPKRATEGFIAAEFAKDPDLKIESVIENLGEAFINELSERIHRVPFIARLIISLIYFLVFSLTAFFIGFASHRSLKLSKI